MPRKLVEHAWRAAQRTRLDTLQTEIDGLIVTLSDILKADFVRSAPGRDPAVLRAAVGTAFHDAFDFEAMSRVLTRGKPVASRSKFASFSPSDASIADGSRIRKACVTESSHSRPMCGSRWCDICFW